MIYRSWLLAVFSLLIWGVTSRLGATCCITPPWQQVAYQADFVGVVECVASGGPVGRYKVEKSWKGLAVGSEFLLEWSSGSFTHLYPVTLCGTRMLVMANKKRFEPQDIGSLFWTLPAEYDIIDAWNMGNEADLKKSFGDTVKTSHEIDLLVRPFLEASESEQERELIFAVVNNYHHYNVHVFKKHQLKELEEDNARDALAIIELQRHTDVQSLVQNMIRRAVDQQQWIMLSALEEVGRRVTLEMLNKERTKGWPPEHFQKFEHTLEIVSSRVNDQPAPEMVHEPFIRIQDTSVAMEERLINARQKISFFWSDIFIDDSHSYSSDLDLLTDQDPEFLTDRLLHWSCPNNSQAHLFIRDFFWHCGMNREANFVKLLKAEDSFVRVMAAIYLCFENETAGRSSLQECSELPGVEGAWAALTLARRGDKMALVRAFELFVPDEKDESFSVRSRLREALQRRLIVLLSNSAKASGLSLPASFNNFNAEYPRYGEKAPEALLHPSILKAWWSEHSESIKLYDPWLDVLEKAKRD